MNLTTAWVSAARFHASPVPPNPAPSGGAYVALCGATVTNVTRVPWTAGTPGACGPCVAQAIRIHQLTDRNDHD